MCVCYTNRKLNTHRHSLTSPWDRVFPPTLRQWSVSVFENILNLASSPMNRTVLFFVSMLIWSFFRIYSTDISTKIRVLMVCLCRLCEHQHSKHNKNWTWSLNKKKKRFVHATSLDSCVWFEAYHSDTTTDDLHGTWSLPSAWSRGPQPRLTCRDEELPPGESRRAEDPTWKRRKSQRSPHLQTINNDDSTPWWSLKL